MLAGANTLGNDELDLVFAGRDPAFGVDLGHPQRDAARSTVVGVFQVDLDPGMPVFAVGMERLGAAPLGGAGAEPAPEQCLEKIAVLGRLALAEPAARALETGVPVGWRAEVLPGLPVGSQLVVGGAFLGVLEHLVGFAHFLETRLGRRLLADVGMVLARQAPVGLLDVVGACVTRQAHQLVIILEFHDFPLEG